MVYVVSIVAVILLAFSLYALHQARAKLDEAESIKVELAKLAARLEKLQMDNVRHTEALVANAEFLANLGLEMRSPLSGVLGLSELLLHTELNSEQRELANATVESAHALLQIVSDLQELARLDSPGTMAYEVGELSVHDILREACATCAESARRKKLFMNSDLDPAIPEKLVGDARNIRNALIYLIRNAIFATERGGIIVQCTRVSSSEGGITLRFCVKDTGVGMSEEDQRNLFAPFSQERFRATFCGAGLGLYICKRLVDTISGTMMVQSKKGQGSEFCFSVELGTKSGYVSGPMPVVSPRGPDAPAV